MTVVSDETVGVVGLNPATMIALNFKGLVLPQHGDIPAVDLHAHDLVLLQLLTADSPPALRAGVDEACAKTGLEAAAFDPVLTALRDRELLLTDVPERPSSATWRDRGWVNERPTDDAATDERLVVAASMVFRLAPDGFEHYDHEGRRDASLTAAELHGASKFRLPTSIDEAFAAHQVEAGAVALDRTAFDEMVARLRRTGVMQPFDPENPLHVGHNKDVEQLRDAIARKHRVVTGLERDVQADLAAEAERRTATGTARMAVVPVVGVDSYWNTPPLALGFLVAYAKRHLEGALEQRYRFHPRWVTSIEQLGALGNEPAIYLFSNYIWNRDENRALSELVKQMNPANITVHGGPNTPKYEADAEAYFRAHPDVDITVRGEGEATFAEILEALDANPEPSHRSVLRDVKGLSYRDGDEIVRTDDRDRIADLDSIPSPYLTGLFDTIADGGATGVVLETNRGCPYGCTFCDWGSATASRIRKFDLDRVLAELEWCAVHGISYVGLADANYGIFERDVTIAEKVAELKAKYGYPILFGTNYAKNTVKHLRPIIEVLAAADIITEGVVSLQSMDTETLLTIKRSNIKLEKYDDLSAEFRRAKLPLSVDLMMGLPGATAQSFRSDLQECSDREVRARVYPTQLLPNSPMNDPAYREEHGIVAGIGDVLTETSSYTKSEWDQMVKLRRVYLLGQRYGALRYVAAYVRSETGIREVEFFERLLDDALDDPRRLPTIAFAFQSTPELMAPPCSWQHFIDELQTYLTESLGVADDSALASAMTVQHAMQPSLGRNFPERYDLAHDFVGWYQQVLATKDAGHRHDWETIVPRLRTLGPGALVVDDPHDVCRTALGGTVDSLSQHMTGWELGSPISRA